MVTFAVLAAFVLLYAAAWFFFSLGRMPPYIPGAAIDPTIATPEAVRGLAVVAGGVVLPGSALACALAFRRRRRRRMREGRGDGAVAALLLLIAGLVGCSGAQPSKSAKPGSYLFLWAGADAESKASHFLAVIDAAPESPSYGSVVASIPTGESGSHPHHTEHEMPANGHLLANGFHAGRT